VQPAVSGLSEDFSQQVMGQNVDAGLPDSIKDVESLGFTNHGLVVRSADGSVLFKQPDHEVNMDEVREAIGRLLAERAG
jgi:hypothetical protein